MKDSLIFKYSPKNINDLEINDSTSILLKTFIQMDNLNILFIGNSGSGKSSLIKVIIRNIFIIFINNN